MAENRFSEDDLIKKGYVKDANGDWAKPIRVTSERGDKLTIFKRESNPRGLQLLFPDEQPKVPVKWEHQGMRKLSLCLFGEPMPKQSVRSFIKNNRIMHYQPKEIGERVKDYQSQIKSKLPKDFVMFTEIVHIRKLHFVFSPLKSFGKCKMDKIARGEIFYKTTKPDLDNLQKIFYDSLNELVFKDDSLVSSVGDMKKIYGTGGCIIVELEGK